MDRFRVSDALGFFRADHGPAKFLGKFVLAAFGLLAAIAVINFWLNQPIYAAYAEYFGPAMGGGEMDMEGFNDRMNDLSMRSSLAMLIGTPLWLGFWAMMEAAVLRRYMRGEGFRLTFGADEGRLLVIGLLWAVFFIAAYIALIIALILPLLLVALIAVGSEVVAAIVMVIVTIGVFILFGWVAARLSPAAAITIRDKEIKPFDGWRATRGKGMTLLGAFTVYALAQIVVYSVLYGIMGVVVFAAVTGGEAFDASTALAAVSQPWVLALLAIVYAVMLLFAALMHYVWAGPAALAAKTDPTSSQRDGVAEEFV